VQHFWRPVLGVVVVAAAVAVCAHADVGPATAAATQQPGEEEVVCVPAPLRVLAALGEDRLRLGEGELVDEWFVDAAKTRSRHRIFPT
jgi:hypothetical protein